MVDTILWQLSSKGQGVGASRLAKGYAQTGTESLLLYCSCQSGHRAHSKVQTLSMS